MAEKSATELLAMLTDNMVKDSAARLRTETMVDALVESGDLLAAAKPDIMSLFGKDVVADGETLVLTQPYTTKDGVIRVAGQRWDFALKELIEARPHMSGHRPEPTDQEALAFEDGSPVWMKAQGEILREHGSAYLAERAAAWGCQLGTRPHGKRPETNPKPDAPGAKLAKIADARKNNPWAFDGPDAMALRLEFIRTHTTAEVRAKAAEAGKSIGGGPLLSGARRVI